LAGVLAGPPVPSDPPARIAPVAVPTALAAAGQDPTYSPRPGDRAGRAYGEEAGPIPRKLRP